MAEAVAGIVAAEQIISTGVEAGVAVALARPTQPLKATLSQIATFSTDDGQYVTSLLPRAPLQMQIPD